MEENHFYFAHMILIWIWGFSYGSHSECAYVAVVAIFKNGHHVVSLLNISNYGANHDKFIQHHSIMF